ncbi:hypothetical protein [Vibrio phage vB_VibM_10AMN]|uniref:Putative tail fiber protein gp53-like C-terminal domain-containing protein n=1 Tax=Staphylococcus phage vB_VibM_10AMN12 TaxID=3076785 RepID=A0AA96R2L3_9CAUD|nr:hypothetical protein [Vibrio phage vB_VibM_10AMN]WNO47455.1 hypothetical protein [Staphylococcus phage vB_VibM_10AMN12]
MATQPTNPIIKIAENNVNLPSTGQPNKNEPSYPLQTTGYDNDQVVTAEELNYIFDNFGEWLKYLNEVTEDTSFTGDDGINLTSNSLNSNIGISVDSSVARTTTTITAGNGLVGGGDLSDNRSVTLGTPSTLSGTTTNAAVTESHTHKLDMASQAEAEAGTDSNKLMSPETVHQAIPFTFSPSSVSGSTGSTTLPNGLIMKWGSGTSTIDTAETFNFSSPFPNACFVINTQTIQASQLSLSVSSKNASGFTIDRAETIGGSVPFDYFAIGY